MESACSLMLGLDVCGADRQDAAGQGRWAGEAGVPFFSAGRHRVSWRCHVSHSCCSFQGRWACLLP